MQERKISAEDTVSTRVICSMQLTVEGAPFQWWAVGNGPTLVTVRSKIFGSLADFTRGNPASFAEALAKRLLATHYERAAELRKAREEEAAQESAAPDPIKKAGWFQV